MYPYFELLGRSFSSYGLFMVLGILLAGFLSIRQIVRLGGCAEDILIVGACGIGFALACGSLLYAFVTFPPELIFSSIRSGDFSVFGGLVFYGGLIGGLFGAVLGLRLSRCAWYPLEKAVVPTIPLGHAFGRIGCVMAGCCHGMPYNGPLALYYPASVLGLSPKQGYFPVQLLESFINIVLYVWLYQSAKKQIQAGHLLKRYLLAYGAARFVLEFFRGDPVRGHFLLLSVSQWISLLIITTCCIWHFLSIHAKKNAHSE